MEFPEVDCKAYFKREGYMLTFYENEVLITSTIGEYADMSQVIDFLYPKYLRERLQDSRRDREFAGIQEEGRSTI